MRWSIFSLFIITSFISLGNKTLIIDTTIKEVNLQEYCYHYEDESDTLSVAQLDQVQWEKLPGNITIPVDKHNQWFKYQLSNPNNKPIQRVIFIPYHLIT